MRDVDPHAQPLALFDEGSTAARRGDAAPDPRESPRITNEPDAQRDGANPEAELALTPSRPSDEAPPRPGPTSGWGSAGGVERPAANDGGPDEREGFARPGPERPAAQLLERGDAAESASNPREPLGITNEPGSDGGPGEREGFARPDPERPAASESAGGGAGFERFDAAVGLPLGGLEATGALGGAPYPSAGNGLGASPFADRFADPDGRASAGFPDGPFGGGASGGRDPVGRDPSDPGGSGGRGPDAGGDGSHGGSPGGESGGSGGSSGGGGSGTAFLRAPDVRIQGSEDGPVRFDLVGDGAEADGVRLVGLEVPEGAGGRVRFGPDGRATFDPDGAFERLGDGEGATVPLAYTLEDAHGRQATGTVRLEVQGANDAPVASNDGVRALEDTPRTFSASQLSGDDFDAEGHPLTVIEVGDARHGQAVLNDDGTVTFTPEADFNGRASFAYTVSDGHGGTATARVAVHVEEVNDRPDLAKDSFHGATEDQPFTFDAAALLANDTDVEGHALEVVGVKGVEGGSAVLNDDGTITFTPDPDFFGTARFKYFVEDSEGARASQRSNVHFDPVNDAPIAVDDVVHGFEDRPLFLSAQDLLANDFDPDGDPLEIFAIRMADGTDNSTGPHRLGLTDDGRVVFDPADDFNGEASFVYGARDSQGGESWATVTVNLAPVDDAPRGVSLEPINPSSDPNFHAAVAENEPGAVIGRLVVDDPDGGYQLHVQGPFVVDGEGYLRLRPNASLDFEAAPEGAAVVVIAHDGQGNGAGQGFAIQVQDRDDAPVAGNDRVLAVDDGTPIAVPVAWLLANDFDQDGEVLGLDGLSAVRGGEVALNGPGTAVVLRPDGPLGAGPGAALFDYTVREAGALDDPSALTSDPARVRVVGFAPGQDGGAVTGGAKGEILIGQGGDDVLAGMGGNDFLRGAAGDDLLDGGDGSDLLQGGPGDDVLLGGQGADTLQGGDGADSLFGQQGADVLNGGAGDDRLEGGGGDDTLQGADGADVLLGNGGLDLLLGGDGDDVLLGGQGDDELRGGDGADLLEGGGGDDLLVGQKGDDALFGNGGADTLQGGQGDDTLDGGAGDDVLSGGGGADRFVLANRDGATDTIADFREAQGDVLDLSALLVAVPDGGDGRIDGIDLEGHLRLAFDGANTRLEVDRDGGGDFADPDASAVFEGLDLTAGAGQAETLDRLLASNQLEVAAS